MGKKAAAKNITEADERRLIDEWVARMIAKGPDEYPRDVVDRIVSRILR